MPAIVTLTLNPAIDLWSETEAIRPGHKVRTFNDQYDPGGGGINVARVLHNFGADVEAVALAGGVTGELLRELLAEAGVPHRFAACAGRTRINHVVRERRTGHEYRFVLAGPSVTWPELEAAVALVEATPCRFLVVSGSLPQNAPPSIMGEIARRATARGARVVVDTSGEALKAAIAGGHLHLLKASLSELEHLSGRELVTPALQEAAARNLVETGRAAMVAVSLGADGALLVTADGPIRKAAPPVEVVSSVGAGDSFLAAMVWALYRGETPAEALAWGVAAGSAALSRPGTKLCTLAEVERFHGRAAGAAAGA